MPKRPERLGRDPLSWIGDSRKERKQGKQGNMCKHSNINKSSKPT